MDDTAHRLITLKVKDVMSRHIVPISAQQTLTEVAALYMQHHVSGAPVLDERGRCVGVLSALDYVKKDRQQLTSGTSVPATRVGDVMSTDFHSIRPEQTMLDAARTMCAKHVHRLPVVDANHLLIGVITSMDITAALINAIDEHEAAAM